jgi:hypothetical protein
MNDSGEQSSYNMHSCDTLGSHPVLRSLLQASVDTVLSRGHLDIPQDVREHLWMKPARVSITLHFARRNLEKQKPHTLEKYPVAAVVVAVVCTRHYQW